MGGKDEAVILLGRTGPLNGLMARQGHCRGYQSVRLSTCKRFRVQTVRVFGVRESGPSKFLLFLLSCLSVLSFLFSMLWLFNRATSLARDDLRFRVLRIRREVLLESGLRCMDMYEQYDD